MADIEYKKHFDIEVESFKERIKKRSAEKIEEALAEQEVTNNTEKRRISVNETNQFSDNICFICYLFRSFPRKRSVKHV